MNSNFFHESSHRYIQRHLKNNPVYSHRYSPDNIIRSPKATTNISNIITLLYPSLGFTRQITALKGNLQLKTETLLSVFTSTSFTTNITYAKEKTWN